MRIKLKNVRLAFCQDLFKPGTFQGDSSAKPAYSSTFLLPKKDPQAAALNKAMEDVAVAKWSAKGKKMLTELIAKDKVCVHDGDLKDQYEGFADCHYVSTRTSIKPTVYDKDVEPVSAESGVVYAGCYVYASIELYAQDNKYGKRINATLRGVQKVRDGDAFAGGTAAAADEFEDIADTGDESDLV